MSQLIQKVKDAEVQPFTYPQVAPAHAVVVAVDRTGTYAVVKLQKIRVI
jgi:hypothetical protein